MVSVAEAHAFAYEVFLQHGVDLGKWEIRWDRHPRYAGVANFATHRVTFSAEAVEAWDWPEVEQLVLHELAHVQVGVGHQHDAVWERQMKALGGEPEEFCPVFAGPAARAWGQLADSGNAMWMFGVAGAAWIAGVALAPWITLAAIGGVLVALLRSQKNVLSADERRAIEEAVVNP